MPTKDKSLPGLDRFEWLVGQETVGRAFEQLGSHCKRILLRAWTLTRWTAPERLAAIARIYMVPARSREAIALAMEERFNPNPAPAWSRRFVTVADLEASHFAGTFARVRETIVLSRPQPGLMHTPVPIQLAPLPQPTTPEGRVREAAVSYFGRRKPFKIEDVAEFFDVSTSTVQKWRRSLQLRCFVRGGVTRLAVEEVFKLIVSSTV